MKVFNIPAILLILTMCVACTEDGNKIKKTTDKGVTSEEKNKADERLKETILKYWDNYNFCDTTRNNIAEGEQRFSNFLMLLNYADSASSHRAIANFIDKSEAEPTQKSRYEALVKHYLENPQSPMRNDAVYAYFLRCKLERIESGNEALRSRIEFKLKMVSKNIAGSIATDFKYIDRNGRMSTLHAIEARATLIIFNDPDCDNCKRILPQLIADPLFDHDFLKVMMVYPDANTHIWETQRTTLPLGWIDAYSPKGEITEKVLYHIPAMPALYLLDAEKRVILKDAHPDVVRSVVANMLQTNGNR